MPYTGPFVRFTWQFIIDTTDEIADTGIKIAHFGGSFDADAWVAAITNAQMDNMAGYLNLCMSTSGGVKWAAYSKMTSVKAAACNAAGEYTSAPKIRAITGVSGTASDVPPQNSVVLSLRSASTFGVANFGRMYLPHTTYANGTTYQGTTAQATNLSIAGADMIGSIGIQADLVQAGSGPVLMSKIATGTTKPIARVGAGRLTDTQRRRRNQLPELPVFTAV